MIRRAALYGKGYYVPCALVGLFLGLLLYFPEHKRRFVPRVVLNAFKQNILGFVHAHAGPDGRVYRLVNFAEGFFHFFQFAVVLFNHIRRSVALKFLFIFFKILAQPVDAPRNFLFNIGIKFFMFQQKIAGIANFLKNVQNISVKRILFYGNVPGTDAACGNPRYCTIQIIPQPDIIIQVPQGFFRNRISTGNIQIVCHIYHLSLTLI